MRIRALGVQGGGRGHSVGECDVGSGPCGGVASTPAEPVPPDVEPRGVDTRAVGQIGGVGRQIPSDSPRLAAGRMADSCVQYKGLGELDQ